MASWGRRQASGWRRSLEPCPSVRERLRDLPYSPPREPEVDRLLQDYKALLEPAVRPPLAYGGMRLVRPDGYAAAVARRGDLGVIARYLDGLLPAASAGRSSGRRVGGRAAKAAGVEFGVERFPHCARRPSEAGRAPKRLGRCFV
jgi:hypothetical protein